MNIQSKIILKAILIILAYCFISSPLLAQDKSEKYPGLIGWDGDINAVCTKINGALYIRNPNTYEAGFGIYNNPTSGVQWYNEDGHLPCLVTEWMHDGCTVRIKHFGDKVAIKTGFMLTIFSRIEIENNTANAVTLDPAPYGGLLALTDLPLEVPAGTTVKHDYYIPYEKSDNLLWTDASLIPATGSWDDHYDHMKTYWETKLSALVQFNQLPDQRLVEAFKSGYIYIQIIKDYIGGVPKMNVGENSYDGLFNHDLIGIAATLLSVGDYSEIKPIMDTFFDSNYPDGTYKYAWPFALYLMKTNDIAHINSKFNTIKTKTHVIAQSRTGPGKIMKQSWGIDATGYWTIDNYSALLGLWSYKYICNKIGSTSEETWAENEYNDLLKSINTQMGLTIKNNKLNYIPAAVNESNNKNRCKEPKDANWASMFHFGRWPWDGYLLNAPQNGVTIDWIDTTYTWGLTRAQTAGLPQHTFGGFPNYSSGYNVAYGSMGLRGEGKYRSESIYGFQFLLDNCLNSPNATFEGINYPEKDSPWIGNHPVINNTFTGSCPHAWSISFNMKSLSDAVLAEKSDGSVIVGRGIPNEWVREGKVIEVSNYPIASNKRMGVKIECIDTATVKLTLTGDAPSGSIIFNLPLFLNHNIETASSGSINREEGTVEFTNTTTSALVYLRNTNPIINGVDENIDTQSGIAVYPNPLTLGKLTVDIKGMKSKGYVSIAIMNSNGQIVTTETVLADQYGNCRYIIDRNNFNTSGLYIVKATDQNHSSRYRKLMVR